MSTLNDILKEKNKYFDALEYVLEWAESRDGSAEADEKALREIAAEVRRTLGKDETEE